MRIHQTLHGYSDGHRLLAASTRIPRGAQRTMLKLSDMSGPSMLQEFEEYLSGYPLPDSDFYCFAKTWYAPEQERPGCVWTHTLLIERSDLGEIAELSSLAKLFQDPREMSRMALYEEPISFDAVSLSHYAPTEPASDPALAGEEMSFLPNQWAVAADVIYSLYGESECLPAHLAARDSKTFQGLTLALWSQQWPDLRASFKFCTGAISNRSLGKDSFDFQIIPDMNRQHFARSKSRAKLVLPHKVRAESDHSDWVRVCADDLHRGYGGELRRYLWNVSSGEGYGRSEYRRLAEVYACVLEVDAHETSVAGLLRKIQSTYPSGKEGRRLKAEVFGTVSRLGTHMLRALGEQELLSELALTPYDAMLSAKDLGIAERAKRLLLENPEKAREIVVRLTTGEEVRSLGEAVLAGVADAMKPSDLAEVGTENPGLLSIFAARNPALASSEYLWHQPVDIQQEVLSRIARNKGLAQKALQAIVWAILDAGSDGIAWSVYRHFMGKAVHLVLDWFDNRVRLGDVELEPAWRRVLADGADASLSWLSAAADATPQTVALVTSYLDPLSKAVKNHGAEVWLRFAPRVERGSGYREVVGVKAFLLCLGLNTPDPGADDLVVLAFETVHESLAKSQLDHKSWSPLDLILPELRWYEWDKCERLRRGLVEAFIRYKWPVAQFLLCTTQEELFASILDTCKKKEYRKFIRQVASAAAHSEAGASPHQRRLLERFRI